MHWIIDTVVSKEGRYQELIDQLDNQNIPYTLVRKPPFAEYLCALHDDLNEDGSNKPIHLDHIEGPVFVTGSTTMEAVSRDHSWSPGYITAPSQSECMEHWGSHMLNYGALMGRLDEIVPPKGSFFCRPDLDLKVFAGTIMTFDHFEEFRKAIMDIEGWTSCPPDTVVMIAPLQPIIGEYRFFIVDGNIVTASLYKENGKVMYRRAEVFKNTPLIRYVTQRLDEWNPRQAFVMDVALLEDRSLKIIETNAISSSGFYAIDMKAFTQAINDLK